MISTDEGDLEEGMLDFFQRKVKEIPPPRDWGKVIVEEHGFVTKGFPDSRNVRQTAYQGQQMLSPPVPTVTDITPSVGEPTGGTAVTITGTNFFDDTINGGVKSSVKIGGSPCTSVVVNHTTITCVTGRHPPSGTVTEGTFDVVVYNVEPTTSPSRPGIFGTLTDGFVYEFAPTVVSVTPFQGPLEGGTFITITGTHFKTGSTVVLVGTPNSSTATSVSVVNSTTITARTGAIATNEWTAITVTSPSGLSGTSNTIFKYQNPPSGLRLDGPNPVRSGTHNLYTITVYDNVGALYSNYDGQMYVFFNNFNNLNGFNSGYVQIFNGSGIYGVTATVIDPNPSLHGEYDVTITDVSYPSIHGTGRITVTPS